MQNFSNVLCLIFEHILGLHGKVLEPGGAKGAAFVRSCLSDRANASQGQAHQHQW